MSSPRRVYAGLLGCCLAVAALVGCSGGGPDDEKQGRPSGSSGTESTTPDDSTLEAELGALFGPSVVPRHEGSFGLDRWEVVSPGPGGPPGPALRVFYPEGSASPSATREYGAPGGGMQVFLPVQGDPMDAVYLRYWVCFPRDFEFVKGGKLPGLYGGTEVSGGDEPDGTDGFSTRLMWRAGGDGEVYLYAPGESGTSLGRGDWTWPRGRWSCVEQRVVLNTPGDEDGAVTVWLDGEQVYADEELMYRTVPSLRIEGVFFSTFFGGDDPSWAPSSDQHADFSDVAISGQPLGCDPG